MTRDINIFILVLILILPMRSFSQIVNFERLFRDTDVLYSVQQTSDNGYILSGLGSESGVSFLKLIKATSEGDTLWTKKYPSAYNADHYKSAAIQTSDGDYIVAGSGVEDSDDTGIFLIKTDAVLRFVLAIFLLKVNYLEYSNIYGSILGRVRIRINFDEFRRPRHKSHSISWHRFPF